MVQEKGKNEPGNRRVFLPENKQSLLDLRKIREQLPKRLKIAGRADFVPVFAGTFPRPASLSSDGDKGLATGFLEIS